MIAEQKAQAELGKLGFKSIKFTGREPYKGEKSLLYTHKNGDPVMDGPVILVDDQGDIKVLSWMEHLR